MKKIIVGWVLCLSIIVGSFGLTSCAFIKDFLSNSDTVSQVALTQGDQQALNTISNDFVDYAEADMSLSAEELESYKIVVRDWRLNGSTWNTYNSLVGKDLNGPYVVYFEADAALEQSDKNARYGNIESWRLNLESRFGAVVEEVVE